MKDANDVLKAKEADLVRVRREIESLRIVAPLLGDDRNADQSDKADLNSGEKTGDDSLNDDLLNMLRQNHQELEATGGGGLFSSVANSTPRFWNALKRAK